MLGKSYAPTSSGSVKLPIPGVQVSIAPTRIHLQHQFPRRSTVTGKGCYLNLVNPMVGTANGHLRYSHVRVGAEDRGKALAITDGPINFQSHVQAKSASSQYRGGEDSGYDSQRALLFQQLPTAGIPLQNDSWLEFEAYVADILPTVVIDDIPVIR